MVVGRNILFKGSESDVTPELLKHEMIHQEQMDRHGVLAFYAIYLKDYLRNLAKFRDHDEAYWNIPFEIEARERERGNA